jgi:hypothetical protein
MSYIGASGINTFDDEIEDDNNILVDCIVSDINNTNNYVWTTSNILTTRINDTSNVLATQINDTSNVFVIAVKDTSNCTYRLDLCLKVLEGTEGSPGDINLTPPLLLICPSLFICNWNKKRREPRGTNVTLKL